VLKAPSYSPAHVVIGQSATHQITHTKGGVLDGRVGFEGLRELERVRRGDVRGDGAARRARLQGPEQHARRVYGPGHDCAIHRGARGRALTLDRFANTYALLECSTPSYGSRSMTSVTGESIIARRCSRSSTASSNHHRLGTPRRMRHTLTGTPS
jgi:hypothetical protein